MKVYNDKHITFSEFTYLHHFHTNSNNVGDRKDVHVSRTLNLTLTISRQKQWQIWHEIHSTKFPLPFFITSTIK